MTSEGKPYGKERYKEIAKERYQISKHCNTSYIDVGLVTPLERGYIIEFITEELLKQKEEIDKHKAKQTRKR